MFNDYFYVFKINNIVQRVVFNKGVTFYVRKNIKRKLKKVHYFEELEVDGETYIIIGTSRVENKVRMKVFFLELYAHLKDENIKPTFSLEEKIIGDSKVKIFKIPKIGWLKL